MLLTIFELEDTFALDCRTAISSEMKDYEDAVMAHTAARIGGYIITRNKGLRSLAGRRDITGRFLKAVGKR